MRRLAIRLSLSLSQSPLGDKEEEVPGMSAPANLLTLSTQRHGSLGRRPPMGRPIGGRLVADSREGKEASAKGRAVGEKNGKGSGCRAAFYGHVRSRFEAIELPWWTDEAASLLAAAALLQ